MKIITMLVTAAGMIGLVLVAVSKVVGHSIGGTSRAGYLHGATALFLLALVIMAFGKCYCSKEKA